MVVGVVPLVLACLVPLVVVWPFDAVVFPVVVEPVVEVFDVVDGLVVVVDLLVLCFVLAMFWASGPS